MDRVLAPGLALPDLELGVRDLLNLVLRPCDRSVVVGLLHDRDLLRVTSERLDRIRHRIVGARAHRDPLRSHVAPRSGLDRLDADRDLTVHEWDEGAPGESAVLGGLEADPVRCANDGSSRDSHIEPRPVREPLYALRRGLLCAGPRRRACQRGADRRQQGLRADIWRALAGRTRPEVVLEGADRRARRSHDYRRGGSDDREHDRRRPQEAHTRRDAPSGGLRRARFGHRDARERRAARFAEMLCRVELVPIERGEAGEGA